MIKYILPQEELCHICNEFESNRDGKCVECYIRYGRPYPLTNGLVERVKRFVYTWMNIDSMLFSLAASHREKHWFSENYRGISREQLIGFRHFTRHMTKEEKRDPQWLLEERVLELAEISGVHEFHISTLASIFHLRYRSNTIYYIPMQVLLLKNLHRTEDLRKEVRYELLYSSNRTHIPK